LSVNARILIMDEPTSALTLNEVAEHTGTTRAYVASFTTTNSFDELVTQLDLMERLGQSDVDTVKSIASYKRDVNDRRIKLEADKKAAVELVAEAKAEKDEVQTLEAKLERSHVDLVGRSDQVEQRLTQLWDIEEQLGALGELQESVLHGSVPKNRGWLAGA